ncbi:MAG: hypothetical protein WDM78_11125 [Puia sp.]
MKILFTSICLCFFMAGFTQSDVQPLPNAKQLAWQNKPFYLFMHFGPNTLPIWNGEGIGKGRSF